MEEEARGRETRRAAHELQDLHQGLHARASPGRLRWEAAETETARLEPLATRFLPGSGFRAIDLLTRRPMPGYGCPGSRRTSNAKGGHNKHETDRRRQAANGAETSEICLPLSPERPLINA